MKVGIVGVGAMGVLMAGHMVAKGHVVKAYDIDPARVADAVARGAEAAESAAALAPFGDVTIVMVGNDEQAEGVMTEILPLQRTGSVVVVTGTHHPETMQSFAAKCARRNVGFVDAPVVFGMDGAREGKLLSLCGADERDFAVAKPAMLAYSRDALLVGPVGAGQLAKACNNLMHWVHCVANFEVLSLAKRYGVDAQRMREVLLQAPAENGTLRRWDNTKFTWQEKDMDVVMDLAQAGGLMLPLTGQVDQLVKKLTAADVAALLYGPECSYMGVKVKPMSADEGGLGG